MNYVQSHTPTLTRDLRPVCHTLLLYMANAGGMGDAGHA